MRKEKGLRDLGIEEFRNSDESIADCELALLNKPEAYKYSGG
jgi:hypothetical protein